MRISLNQASSSPMTICTVVIVAISVSVMPCASHASEGRGGSQLVCDESEFDFGAVGQQEQFTHRFELHNRGDETIRIARIVKSCGCTRADVSQKELGPGEMATVDVTLDTAKRRGPINQSVLVRLDDPKAIPVKLMVSANVQADFVALPGKLVFSGVPKGTGRLKTLRCMSDSRSDMKVVSAKSNLPFISCKIQKNRGPAGSPVIVSVRLSKHAPEGVHKGKVILYTNVDKKKYYEVECLAYVMSSVLVRPGKATIALDEAGKGMSLISICTPRGERVRVREVRSSSPYITADILKEGLHAICPIRISVDISEHKEGEIDMDSLRKSWVDIEVERSSGETVHAMSAIEIVPWR